MFHSNLLVTAWWVISQLNRRTAAHMRHFCIKFKVEVMMSINWAAD